MTSLEARVEYIQSTMEECNENKVATSENEVVDHCGLL